MLVKIRKKSQITIPKQVIEKLGLQEGDKLEIKEKDGAIVLLPVAVYPKEYVERLEREVIDIRKRLSSGEQKTYGNVDEMMDVLESK